MSEKINFSGGEIRSGTASNAVFGTEVWNRDPLPKPPPPKVWTYKLTVQQGDSKAQATATTMEALISFELQMRELGYEFIKLERLDDGQH